MITLKLNLTQLVHKTATMKDKEGKEIEVLILPIKKNNFYRGEKGVYLDMSALEIKEPKTDDTHIIKQKLDKELYNSLTEEQKNKIPIIGNLRIWKSKENINITDSGVELSDIPLPF